MRPTPPRRATPRLELAPEQRWLVALFLAVVVAQCLLIAGAVFVVNGARAYVAGESLWSKAQKNATSHLHRYAATQDGAEYDAYLAEIAVPLADRRAREAMFGAKPDRAAARQALIEGRNDPGDADGMITFMRLFQSVPEIALAIDLWRRADDGIADLDRLARALRDATRQGDTVAIQAIARDIDRMDARLTVLEEEFSYTLGAAARRGGRLVVIVASIAAALLLMLGATLAIRMLRRARHLESQLGKFAENASDLFTLLDPAGRYHFASPNIETQLGWTQEDLAGLSALDLVHPDDQPRVAERLALVVAEPEQPQSVEFRFRHKDGSYRIFESVGTGLEEGGRREIMVVSRDVTETRALERDLLRAQKMESIGRLAGGIAHDFNNVLTALLGHAEEARTDPQDADRVKRELDEIVHGAERATRLTRQLLAFARRQVIAPKVVDLGRLVLGLRGMLGRLLGESIVLELSVEPELCAVRADPGQIEQVIVNLVVNARDAMPEGGRLVIEAGGPGLATAPGADTPEECVVLAVTDTGCGIDEDTARHLFEPFFTTKRDGAGTGLGLATCYGIVQQAGGEIRVASKPGRGTRFEVLLPRVRAVAEPIEATVHEEAPRGSERILVVEDEPMVRRVTVRNLAAKGYAVLSAEDGVEALEVLGRETVALVVSDVAMPRMGGSALAAQIAERWPAIRVLLVSGHTDDATLGTSETVAFLQKPFSREQLAHAVRRTLDG